MIKKVINYLGIFGTFGLISAFIFLASSGGSDIAGILLLVPGLSLFVALIGWFFFFHYFFIEKTKNGG